MNFRRTLSRHFGLEKIPLFRPDLQTLLTQADPKAPLSERIRWLEEVISWIRLPFALEQRKEKKSRHEHIQDGRVKFLLIHLEQQSPELRNAVAETLKSILLETDPVGLFSQVGLGRDSSLVVEASDRLLRKILPSPRIDSDLSELFIRIFRSEEDADWVENLEDETIGQLHQVLFPVSGSKAHVQEHFRASINSSLIILAAQISAVGLSPEIRERSEVRVASKSWFFQMGCELYALCSTDEHQPVSEEERRKLQRILEGCRSEIKAALDHLNQYGVSVSIVYRLELLEQTIERCEKLLAILFLEAGTHWQKLLADLVRGSFAHRKLSELIQNNLHLMARKVVERVGVSGEQYIVRNRREYLTMLLSAMGGGVLTVGTTLCKFLVGGLKPAPFFEGILLWLNYSGSFLTMQLFHFTLATKQPSMTASALAGKLSDLRRRSQISQFVNELLQISRSQFVAALGNLGMVIPGAILIDRIYFLSFGQHVLAAAYGQKLLESLNPFTSMTVPYAALTGVLLWLSSIAAGWAENWVVYRRIPEAFSAAPKKGQIWVANWLVRNVAGFAGNVSLGFFLAFTPVMGRFFGLPLDVRHVTLSAGALTFAVCGIGLEAISGLELGSALFGIALIGILNFGVSFFLALYTAMRARNVEPTWLWKIFSALFRRLRYRPYEFFLPLSGKRTPVPASVTPVK
ncbi:MAG: hypothetical protein A2X94_07765 [Bdellovibrionales bacterium GWB1_55_8]|nr:MAG: hypothetical protein A2X94_07765 [Bdellovibrionales bacterium GWB1_55_8]